MVEVKVGGLHDLTTRGISEEKPAVLTSTTTAGCVLGTRPSIENTEGNKTNFPGKDLL